MRGRRLQYSCSDLMCTMIGAGVLFLTALYIHSTVLGMVIIRFLFYQDFGVGVSSCASCWIPRLMGQCRVPHTWASWGEFVTV
jgi:hypothetical protein